MTVVDLLLEGFESAFLPCSVILLLPGLASALAARQESTSALAGFTIGSMTLAYIRFSDRGLDLPDPVIALILAVSVVLLLIPLVRRLNVVSGLGGLAAGIGAGALWTPCVGSEFGSLLVDLPSSGAPGALQLWVYMAGVMAPLVVVGAFMYVIPRGAFLPVRPVMMAVGGGALAILSLATAAGLIDNVIGQLVEWSVT